MIQADYLFLLTDVDCLYTENPRRFPETAKPVRLVRDIEALKDMVSVATLGSSLGTGGMETKLIAAELATGAGVATIISNGSRPSSILDIVSQPALVSDDEYTAKTPLHTVFLPKESPLSDRRWWVLHGLKPRGRIIIDEGAYRAIARTSSVSLAQSSSSISTTPSASTTPSSSMIFPAPSTETPAKHVDADSARLRPSSSGNGGRLLPAGVIAVEGLFAAGQAVTIVVLRKKRGRSEDRQIDKGRPALEAQAKSADPFGGNELGTPSQGGHEHGDEENHMHLNNYPERTEGEQEEDEQIEFGRGLANYNAQEMDRIKGRKSSDIEKILGYIEAEHCVESITSLRKLEL